MGDRAGYHLVGIQAVCNFLHIGKGCQNIDELISPLCT